MRKVSQNILLIIQGQGCPDIDSLRATVLGSQGLDAYGSIDLTTGAYTRSLTGNRMSSHRCIKLANAGQTLCMREDAPPHV